MVNGRKYSRLVSCLNELKMAFKFEELKVWQKALEFSNEIDLIIEDL